MLSHLRQSLRVPPAPRAIQAIAGPMVSGRRARIIIAVGQRAPPGCRASRERDRRGSASISTMPEALRSMCCQLQRRGAGAAERLPRCMLADAGLDASISAIPCAPTITSL